MPRRFRFRHPIVRRAVYEDTPAGWRIGAHERAAAALAERGATATARAHHVERSAAQGDETAIAVLREAAQESLLRAPATAAAVLRHRAAAPPAGRAARAARRAAAADGPGARRHRPVRGQPRRAAREPRDRSGARRRRCGPSSRRRARASSTCSASTSRRTTGSSGRSASSPTRLSPEGVSLHGRADDGPPAPHALRRRCPSGAIAPQQRPQRLDDPALRAVALAGSRPRRRRGGRRPGGRRAARAGRRDSSTRSPTRSWPGAWTRPCTWPAASSTCTASRTRTRTPRGLIDVGRATGQGQLFPLAWSVLGITLVPHGASGRRPPSRSTAPSRPRV